MKMHRKPVTGIGMPFVKMEKGLRNDYIFDFLVKKTACHQ